MKDYKKILEGVVDIINTAEESDIGFVNICAYIDEKCPELKSEDERMWNLIRKYAHYNIPDMALDVDHITRGRLETWLEKQGTFYTKKDVDDAYLEGVTSTKNEIEKQYKATYQVRKDIATFIFNYRGYIKDRAKWMDYLGIKVSFAENKSEQKPVKNFFETWKYMRCEVYAQASGNRHEPNCSDNTTKMFSLNDIDEIIEKLSEQSHTNKDEQKWREEDEKNLNRIYMLLAEAADEHAFSTTCRLIGDKECVKLQDFLKSLSPQNRWKPSVEQMDALLYILRRYTPSVTDKPAWDALQTLELMLEQLKKLKG